jgi:hypothetical protein
MVAEKSREFLKIPKLNVKCRVQSVLAAGTSETSHLLHGLMRFDGQSHAGPDHPDHRTSGA